MSHASFKVGTYKGMDLTFGGEKHYGGMLIRAIMNLTTKEYIEGPCNSVSVLLNNAGVKEFKDLKLPSWPDNDGSAFDAKSPLGHLVFCGTELPHRDIVTSPRVGLTLKRYDTEKEKYLLADYRYLNFPELCKKQNVLI